MRWNGEVKGILKSLKVSRNFLNFEFLSNYYPRAKKYVFIFVFVVSWKRKKNDSTNIHVRITFLYYRKKFLYNNFLKTKNKTSQLES